MPLLPKSRSRIVPIYTYFYTKHCTLFYIASYEHHDFHWLQKHTVWDGSSLQGDDHVRLEEPENEAGQDLWVPPTDSQRAGGSHTIRKSALVRELAVFYSEAVDLTSNVWRDWERGGWFHDEFECCKMNERELWTILSEGVCAI